MPDNFLIVPAADVDNGRLTRLDNAISTTDLDLTVTSVTNGTELVVFQLSRGVTGTPQAAGAAAETHVFALLGQSNMVGRAPFDGGPKWPARTFQIGRSGGDAGQVIPAQNPADGPAASRPLRHVNPTYGEMGLDMQFAIDYLADKPNVTLVLIPGAQGGTGFSTNHWNKGDARYDNTVRQINDALAANPGFQFRGFLWHQGESDTGIPGTYAGLLDQMIADLRSDVSAAGSTTPFILGGLTPGVSAQYDAITALIAATPARVAHTAFVDASDLARVDATHFDAASLRTLGSRYNSALSLAAANAPGLPGAPQALAASPGDAQVALTWSPPALTGGAAITDYIIERDAGAGFAPLADGVSATPGYTDSGLSNGTAYSYRLRAVTALGTGPATAAVTATPAGAAPGPAAETGAVAHWLFGEDNLTHADLVSGRLATGPAHAPSPGYVTSPAGIRQGLDSGIPEADEQTMCFVFRTTGRSMIGGTFQAPGADTSTGVSPYAVTPSSVYVNMRGGPFGNREVSSTAGFTSDFTFVAVSKNATNGDYVLFVGDDAGHSVVSGTGGQTTSPRTIGIGNLHYNSATFSAQISSAEAILFDSAKTAAELDAIYQRSRTRLAARGLTLR